MIAPPPSVEPYSETWITSGIAACIWRSRSGGPTLSITRAAERSASAKPRLVEQALGDRRVGGIEVRSPARAAISSSAGRGSKNVSDRNAAPAAAQAISGPIAPRWKSGHGAHRRSPAARRRICATSVQLRTIASCVRRQPRGSEVVPLV